MPGVAHHRLNLLERDREALETGDGIFHGILANWLLCATFETIENRKLMFYSDPVGGDGVIRDEATGRTWQTEHVYVSQHSTGPNAKTLILDAI